MPRKQGLVSPILKQTAERMRVRKGRSNLPRRSRRTPTLLRSTTPLSWAGLQQRPPRQLHWQVARCTRSRLPCPLLRPWFRLSRWVRPICRQVSWRQLGSKISYKTRLKPKCCTEQPLLPIRCQSHTFQLDLMHTVLHSMPLILLGRAQTSTHPISRRLIRPPPARRAFAPFLPSLSVRSSLLKPRRPLLIHLIFPSRLLLRRCTIHSLLRNRRPRRLSLWRL
mmetsp:Transcript_40449/g.74905  ORF Transcript_40449/g.74905 Transcript_40449/m.74905 type:complete len:223 (-) Transcript_40449:562-1230(-)